MLSAWAVLAAPLAAAFVITEPSADKPLVAGQNNTIAWDAESDTSTPPSFSIEVKTNGQWIPLGYEFADIPSDQGEINIQPLGSGYETAVRFVVDGEVLASTEDFFVQPPKPRSKRDEPELSAAVAPAATSVGESLLLAPTAAAGAAGSGEGSGEGDGEGEAVPSPVAEEEEGESLLLAPSSTSSEEPSGVTTRIANGPTGPAPTPGATIVANGTTLTLSEDTATVEVQDAGSTLLHQSPEPSSSSSSSSPSSPASPANPANPASPAPDSDSDSKSSSSHKSTGSPSSSGPLRLINDGESELAASGVITPGTLTAVTASAGPSLKLASGDEGSLILASGKATAAGMGAGAPAVTADAGVAVASPSPSRKSGSGADAAGANQSSSASSARPLSALTVLAGIIVAMAL